MARYFVGPTGDNRNPGTRERPFASVDAIAGGLWPGDTVFYLTGTYPPVSGTTDAVETVETGAVITLDGVHGTAEAPITLSPEPGARVTLRSDGDTLFLLRDSSHITIDGFEIARPQALSGDPVPAQTEGSHAITIRVGFADTDSGMAATQPDGGDSPAETEIQYAPGTSDPGVFDSMPVATGVDYTLDPSSPESGLVGSVADNGKPIWSAYETAAHIGRSGGTWADHGHDLSDGITISYSFDAAYFNTTGEAFDLTNRLRVREILDYYAQVINVRFVEVTSADLAPGQRPDITYQFEAGTTNGGGWAHLPSAAGGIVNIGYVSWETSAEPGNVLWDVILHETGHALGLSHPGDYGLGNTGYAGEADHWNDTTQFSVMSYWDASNTGGAAARSGTVLLHDLLALQIEYGANTQTNAGDTVYGFNSTAGRLYDLSTDRDLAFAIWDGGGVDTLDLSGALGAVRIDLREGGFSSTPGWVNNIAVGYGVQIENAVGGAGADALRGNALDNVIRGGWGNDLIIGGADSGAGQTRFSFTGVQLNEDPLERGQSLAVAQFDGFSGRDGFTLEMLVQITRVAASSVAFVSYAAVTTSNAFVVEGMRDGVLRVTIGNQSLDTTILTRTLVDGDAHRLSVSWDRASGLVSVYVDGALADSGTLQAGYRIAADGVLVFGQEQDSLGGGFDRTQVFQGTMGDMRVFDGVRSAAAIAADAFAALDATVPGLRHAWRTDALTEGDSPATLADDGTGEPSTNLTALLGDGFVVTQSSVYAGYGAANLLDGDAATFNHTLNGGAEWVSLGFGQALSVDFVELVNRASSGSRLNGATVSLLDETGAVVWTSDPISAAVSAETLRIHPPAAITAAALRFDQTTNYLHLAEVNVFGTAPEGIAAPVNDAAATALVVFGGASILDTAAEPLPGTDSDTLIGGEGDDTILGGMGDDRLEGDGMDLRAAPEVFDLVGVSGSNEVSVNATGVFPTGSFTVEFLWQQTALVNEAYSFRFPGMAIYRFDSGVPALMFWDASEAAWNYGAIPELFTDGALHRLTLAYDDAGGVLAIYIDGALVNTLAFTPGTRGAAANGGLLPENGTVRFGDEGRVGDLRIYDHALDAARVAGQWAASLADPGAEAGLVQYWTASGNTLVSALGGADMAASGTPEAVQGTLWTISHDDDLLGGDGADTLAGGQGDDRLEGGAGADVFVMTPGDGNDTVADFAPSTDRIDVTGYAIALADVGFTAEAAGLRVLLGADSLLLSGLAQATLEAADFIGLVVPNTAPVLSGPATVTASLAALAADPVLADFSASDAEGDTLTFAVGGPDAGVVAIDAATGLLRYTGALDGGAGLLDLVVSVSDAEAVTQQALRVDLWPQILEGTASGETLSGTTSADLFLTGPGADINEGRGGDDVFRLSPVQHDAIWEASRYTYASQFRLSDGTPYGATLTGKVRVDDAFLGGAGRDRIEGSDAGEALLLFDPNYSVTNPVLQNYDARIIAVEEFLLGDGNDILDLTFEDFQQAFLTDALIDGGAGNDVLYDGAGSSVLIGGLGQDSILGNRGDDTLTGGEAGGAAGGLGDGTQDRFVYGPGSAGGRDVITDFEVGIDKLWVIGFGARDLAAATAGPAPLLDWSVQGADTLVRIDDGRHVTTILLLGVTGFGSGDLFVYDTAAATVTDPGSNPVAISGGVGDDVLTGTAQHDTLLAGVGADILDGGAGDDVFALSATETDGIWEASRYTYASQVSMSNGTPYGATLTGKVRVDDTFLGGAGQDSLTGTAASEAVLLYDPNFSAINSVLAQYNARIMGVDVFDMGAGDDIVDLTSEIEQQGYAADVLMLGGEGDDFLMDGAGNSTLVGGAGSDRLVGWKGDDVLTGGAAGGTGDGEADRFVFSAATGGGTDHITDYEDGLDTLRFVGFGVGTLAEALSGGILAVATGASDTVLTLTGEGKTTAIVIDGFTGVLGADDLLFYA